MQEHSQPSITAAELAQRVGGELCGDGARTICGVGTLEEAGPEALSWLAHPKLLPRLAGSKAGVVLVPKGCEVPPERTAINVADPDMAVCVALQALAPPAPQVPEGVDPSARVAGNALVEGASIGPGVYVGAGATVDTGTQLHAGVYVGDGSRIGRDCVLWPNVVVRERTVIGERVIIHPNATIGADGFGYHQRDGKNRKIPQIGHVVIEDDVEIGANTCIDRARTGATRIGRGTKIDNLVQIGHNADIGEDTIVVAQCGISGSTTIGDHVMLGGQVGVVDHLRIGNNVMVASKSAVMGDIPDGAVYRGVPATDRVAFGRRTVALRRLPNVLEQFRVLTKRVEALESAANDRARS